MKEAYDFILLAVRGEAPLDLLLQFAEEVLALAELSIENDVDDIVSDLELEIFFHRSEEVELRLEDYLKRRGHMVVLEYGDVYR